MTTTLKLGIPKGSLQDATISLFKRSGWKIETNGRSRGFWVDINPDGTVRNLQFVDQNAVSIDPPVYIYTCTLVGGDCSALADHVTVDMNAKTVTFTNLSVPAITDFYDGTGPLTINGTLTYTGTLVFP